MQFLHSPAIVLWLAWHVNYSFLWYRFTISTGFYNTIFFALLIFYFWCLYVCTTAPLMVLIFVFALLR